MNNIFNQEYIGSTNDVMCPVCNKPVSMREAYFDSYNHDRYVHKDCLSDERKIEVVFSRRGKHVFDLFKKPE